MAPTAPSKEPAAPPELDLERERQERWRLSVHESAHLVVSLVLAEEGCLQPGLVGAFLLPGGGLSYPAWKDFSKLDTAIVSAAGPASSPIARKYRPPRGEVAPISAVNPPEGISVGTFSGIAADHAGGIPDAELVKVYCTSTNSGPTAWAGRWRMVHAMTRKILREHRQEILAIARALFRSGAVLPSEIEGILAGTMPAKQETR